MRVLLALCTAVYFLDGLIHSILGPLAPGIARDMSTGKRGIGDRVLGQSRRAVHRTGRGAVACREVRAAQRGDLLRWSALAWGSAPAQRWAGSRPCSPAACSLAPSSVVACRAALPWWLAGAPARRRGLAIMVLFMGYGSGATAAGVARRRGRQLAQRHGHRRGACLLTALLAFLWLRPPVEPSQEKTVEGEQTGVLGILSSHYRLGHADAVAPFIAMLTISYCLNSWLPTVLIQVGRDEQLASISVSIFSFGGIAAALVIGLLIDRFGAGRTLAAFIGISALLLAGLGQVLATASVGVLMALLAASGFFALGAYGGINVILSGFYPRALQATGIGWAKSIGRVGTVIAPIGIGAALEVGASRSTVLSLFAVPALIALVALVAVARRMRASP